MINRKTIRVLPIFLFMMFLSLFVAQSSQAAGYSTVYIGDSRTVGMYQAIYGSGNGMSVSAMEGNDYWVAHTGSGVAFVESSWNQVKSHVDKSSTRVVILSGVNDLGNSERYKTILKTISGSCDNVYFVSVNPTDPKKYSGAASNSAIQSFNSTMKSFCSSNDIRYINTYDSVFKKVQASSSATDAMGLHYSNEVYKMIYAMASSFSEGTSSDSDDKPIHGLPERGEEADEPVRELAPSEDTKSNAFSMDSSEVKKMYMIRYGWDYNKAKVREWTNPVDGQEVDFERMAGWQEEFLGDNILTTKEYLGLGNSSGSGKGGGDVGEKVAEIALGEVGNGPSKYLKWFYGDEDDDDEKDKETKPWGGIFVSWVMNKADLIDTGFWEKLSSIPEIYDYVTGTLGFKAYNSNATKQFGGNSYSPELGDLMFHKEDGVWTRVGIVSKVESDGWYTVEGDCDDKVKKNHYSADDPDTITDTVIVAMEYPGAEYADGSVEQNKQTIYQFLTTEMGYNSAAACGVMANIQGESGFVADINENGSGAGYGICQWTGSRRSDLIAWCNQNGLDASTLNGQLWFLKDETTSKYSDVHNYLLNVSNSSQGAADAARYWCLHWEIPEYKYARAAERAGWAQSTYWPTFGDK